MKLVTGRTFDLHMFFIFIRIISIAFAYQDDRFYIFVKQREICYKRYNELD